MSWGKNSKKKPIIANNFCFPVDLIRPTGPMVTRYTSGLSQLLIVKMSWGKNSKEKPLIKNNFCFLVDFIRPTIPMVTMMTRYTGGLNQIGQNMLGKRF